MILRNLADAYVWQKRFFTSPTECKKAALSQKNACIYDCKSMPVLGENADLSRGFVYLCDNVLSKTSQLQQNDWWEGRYSLLQECFVSALLANAFARDVFVDRGTIASRILPPSEMDQKCHAIAQKIVDLAKLEFYSVDHPYLSHSTIVKNEDIYRKTVKEIKKLYELEGRKLARYLVDRAFVKWTADKTAYNNLASLEKDVKDDLASRYFDVSDSSIIMISLQQHIAEKASVFDPLHSRPVSVDHPIDEFRDKFLQERCCCLVSSRSQHQGQPVHFVEPSDDLWICYQEAFLQEFGHRDSFDQKQFQRQFIQMLARRMVANLKTFSLDADKILPELFVTDHQDRRIAEIVNCLQFSACCEFRILCVYDSEIFNIVISEFDNLYSLFIRNVIEDVAVKFAKNEIKPIDLENFEDLERVDVFHERFDNLVHNIYNELVLKYNRRNLFPPESLVLDVIKKALVRYITNAKMDFINFRVGCLKRTSNFRVW